MSACNGHVYESTQVAFFCLIKEHCFLWSTILIYRETVNILHMAWAIWIWRSWSYQARLGFMFWISTEVNMVSCQEDSAVGQGTKDASETQWRKRQVTLMLTSTPFAEYCGATGSTHMGHTHTAICKLSYPTDLCACPIPEVLGCVQYVSACQTHTDVWISKTRFSSHQSSRPFVSLTEFDVGNLWTIHWEVSKVLDKQKKKTAFWAKWSSNKSLGINLACFLIEFILRLFFSK